MTKSFLVMTNSDRKAGHLHRRHDAGECWRGGFTLIELLAVVCIIGLVASLALSAVQAMRKRSKSAGCISSLRQLYVGASLFAADNQGALPYSENENGSFNPTWMRKASEYALGGTNGGVLMCPDGPYANGKQTSTTQGVQANYGINVDYLRYVYSDGSGIKTAKNSALSNFVKMHDLGANTILFYDSGSHCLSPSQAMSPAASWSYIPGYSKNKSVPAFYAAYPKVTPDAHNGRHGKTINFVRGDGSVGQKSAEDFVDDKETWK
jgi:prepilin-type N-terminal cleavage/methylation domain-containing protein